MGIDERSRIWKGPHVDVGQTAEWMRARIASENNGILHFVIVPLNGGPDAIGMISCFPNSKLEMILRRD